MRSRTRHGELVLAGQATVHGLAFGEALSSVSLMSGRWSSERGAASGRRLDRTSQVTSAAEQGPSLIEASSSTLGHTSFEAVIYRSRREYRTVHRKVQSQG